MRVGLLTGGGDAPGLNGVIEAVSRTLIGLGHEVIGIRDGFEGVFGGKTVVIGKSEINGIHALAGTFLGTSNKSGTQGREEEFLRAYQGLKIDGLVACGGDGTFAALKTFEKQIPLLGVPKTIDNDLSGTDLTFGFDTACTVVAESIEALRSTAEAHSRIMVVETMGRTAGWICLGGGLAGYADVILIPERPYDRKELLGYLRKKKNEGRRGLLIAVSEAAHEQGQSSQVAFSVKGSPQAERFGGVAQMMARWLEAELNWEARHVVLGHLQRSRFPTVTDRFLTLSMGVEVANMAHENQWGQAVVYREGRVQRAPISELMGPPRLVSSDHRWIELARSVGFFV